MLPMGDGLRVLPDTMPGGSPLVGSWRNRWQRECRPLSVISVGELFRERDICRTNAYSARDSTLMTSIRVASQPSKANNDGVMLVN